MPTDFSRLTRHGPLILFGLLWLGVAIFTTGCIGNRMHWPDESILEGDGHAIAFVELDDQGELWAPSQVNRALDRISEANRHPDGAIMVLYVHGWGHNASAEDTNVEGFRAQLARIAAGERVRSPDMPREVVGIYVGWRGKTSSFLPFSMLAFYGRRGAATRVASLSTTETIYRLLIHTKRNRQTTVVLIGHSFGGMILETALSQALVGFLLQNDEQEEIDFPADLVFLVNPASQSIQAKQFVEILERHRLRLYRTDAEGQKRFERPLIVSMTSSGDEATGVAFPVGLGIKGLSKRFRPYGAEYCNAVSSQSKNYRRTPGHNRELLSHRVTAQPLPQVREEPMSLEAMAAGLEVQYDPLAGVDSFSISGTRTRFTIQRQVAAFNDTPYWIMRVPTSILPDHGGVFDAEVQELMGALIVITGALTPDVRTVMVREDGVRPLAVVQAPGDPESVLFLDRSRRIYRVSPDDGTTFFACMPPAASAVENSLGFSQAGRVLYLSRQTPPDAPAQRLEVIRLRLLDDDVAVEARHELETSGRLAIATFDVSKEKVFVALADSPRIEVASLADKRPTLKHLVSVGGLASIALLHYEPSGNQLFVSDGVDKIIRIDLSRAELRSEVVATGLGFPTAMAFDPALERLYVATREKGIWQIGCSEHCTERATFSTTPELINPLALAVTPKGTVWVGDAKAHMLLDFSQSGDLLDRHDELPRR